MRSDTSKKNCPTRRTWLRASVLASLVLTFGSAGAALANPVGPQVVGGQADFATAGNTLTITNAPNTIINWQGFSIDSNEVTRFVQESAASGVLNRVVGQDPSAILGALQSNGRVFLINPNGILFGQEARIDVNGLVASTLGLSDQDFLAGRLNFTAGAQAGNIANQGTITTPAGGQVFLIAPDIENSGVITAPDGQVMLAAGHSVQLVDSANPELAVVVSAPSDAAVNLGKIVAESGQVGIFGAIIRQAGTVSADSAVADAAGRIFFKAAQNVTLEAGSTTTASGASGGTITVQATAGTTLAAGTVAATGSNGQGGEIHLLGDRVGLVDSALVDASGDSNGGTVLVGGDFQGKNPAIQNASRTYVGSDALIKANALTSGNGGMVVVWADEATRYYGTISARGGAHAGNGGQVEVSGKQYLDFNGIVDAAAPMGKNGTLLLDPTNIEIVDDPTTAGPPAPGWTDDYNDVNDFLDADIVPGLTKIDPDTLNNDDIGTNVELQATNDITVTDALVVLNGQNLTMRAGNDITANADIDLGNADQTGGVLTMRAGNDIDVNSEINTHGGALILSANDNNNGYASGNGTVTSDSISIIDTNGGNITVSGIQVNLLGSLNADSEGTDGSLTVTSVNGITLSDASYFSSLDATNTGDGNIDITADDVDDLTATNTGDGGIVIDANGVDALTATNSGNGDISIEAYGVDTLNATNSGSGDISVTVEGEDDARINDITNANGDVYITTNYYDIILNGTIAAPNGDVSLVAEGAIVDNHAGGPDITARYLEMVAKEGIGSNNPLETRVSTLSAENSPAGNIGIVNTGALQIDKLHNEGGSITLENYGAIHTANGGDDNSLLYAAGDFSLTAHSPLIIGTAGLTADGIIYLTAGGWGWGNSLVILGDITTTGGWIELTAGDFIYWPGGIVLAPDFAYYWNGSVTLTAPFNDICYTLNPGYLNLFDNMTNTAANTVQGSFAGVLAGAGSGYPTGGLIGGPAEEDSNQKTDQRIEETNGGPESEKTPVHVYCN